MWLLRLLTAVSRELLGAAWPSNPSLAVKSDVQWKPVGVMPHHLTQLQARCLLAACAFWAVIATMALPSLLIFGVLIVPMWSAAEVVFWISWHIIYWRLNKQPVPHCPPPHVNPREVFDRFIWDQKAISKYIDIIQMISKWHWDVPVSELTRGNVADLLCYGFYFRSQQQMADAGLGHVPDHLVSEVEAAWGVRFRSGPFVSRPMMRHLWEPVRAFYRPLVFYAGVELLILMKHTMLLAAGFRAHMHGDLRYYTHGLSAATTTTSVPPPPQHQQHIHSRSAFTHTANADIPASGTPAAAETSADAPILLLHGVGLGLLPYLNFLLQLSSLGRPVIAVEVRHLSMRVCLEVPEEDEIVEDITRALVVHGVRQVHVVAHSYGTFMASRLVQLHKVVVVSLTLLDPVCFIMFSGKLIRNFVYSNPLQGASTLTWFIARDLAHAVSVSRRFYWSLLNLWPNQLPRHTLVSLSAQDELVPVPEVLAMLKEVPGVRVRVHDGHRHADFIKDLPEQAKMVQMVAELLHQVAQEQQQTTAVGVEQVEQGSVGAVHPVASDSASELAAVVDAGSAHFYRAKAYTGLQQQQAPGIEASHHARSDSASSYKVAAAPGCTQ